MHLIRIVYTYNIFIALVLGMSGISWNNYCFASGYGSSYGAYPQTYQNMNPHNASIDDDGEDVGFQQAAGAYRSPTSAYGSSSAYQGGGSNRSQPAFNRNNHESFDLASPSVVRPRVSIDAMGNTSHFESDDEESEIDAGNWYEKLHWWKEAKRVYTIDIHSAMEQLKDIEQSYEAKKGALMNQLTAYFASLPVTKDAALTVINNLLAELKTTQTEAAETLEVLKAQEKAEEKKGQKKTAEGTPPKGSSKQPIQLTPVEKQQKLVDELAQQNTQLEALKETMGQLLQLEQRLKEALTDMPAKQYANVHSYDERALDNFERIEKVFDDKKAHRYYDVIENSLENIRSILQYLQGPLNMYIDQTWAKVQQLMPHIKKQIDDLNKQGIEVRVLSEKEKAERAEFEKKREAARLKAIAERKAAEEQRKLPWYRKLINAISSFFSSLWSSITGLFGGQEVAKPHAPAKPALAKPSAPAAGTTGSLTGNQTVQTPGPQSSSGIIKSATTPPFARDTLPGTSQSA